VTVPPGYGATRAGLHAVAEHVLAAALHGATGRIGLRAAPGGFGTPVFQVDGSDRQVRVEGTDLVVLDGSIVRRSPLHTIGEAAAFVGIEPGGPGGVYSLVTPLEPDVPLALDPAAATVLHGLFALTDAALGSFGEQHAAAQPSVAQVWPEHFDLALTMAEVNYGGSPGDADHPGPYLYVGPWSLDGLPGEFWNEPFGASRGLDEIGSPADALDFFEAGRRAAS
jgi:hypothetical protein